MIDIASSEWIEINHKEDAFYFREKTGEEHS